MMRAARERWRLANLDKQRIRNDRWRAGNPDKQSKSEKHWRDGNKPALRVKHSRHKHRRRTLVKQLETDVIDIQFLANQRAIQGDACAYCIVPLDGGGELDHVTPVTKGGRHSKDNLVWACTPCNRKKSNKLGWAVINPASSLQD